MYNKYISTALVCILSCMFVLTTAEHTKPEGEITMPQYFAVMGRGTGKTLLTKELKNTQSTPTIRIDLANEPDSTTYRSLNGEVTTIQTSNGEVTTIQTPTKKETYHEREVRVCKLIEEVCDDLDFHNYALIKAIVFCESNFNTHSISSENAQGLMQIVPRWFVKEMAQAGVTDLCKDERGNLFIGISHIKRLLKLYDGDVSKTLVAYHDGCSAVENGIYSTAYSKWVIRVVGDYS